LLRSLFLWLQKIQSRNLLIEKEFCFAHIVGQNWIMEPGFVSTAANLFLEIIRNLKNPSRKSQPVVILQKEKQCMKVIYTNVPTVARFWKHLSLFVLLAGTKYEMQKALLPFKNWHRNWKTSLPKKCQLLKKRSPL